MAFFLLFLFSFGFPLNATTFGGTPKKGGQIRVVLHCGYMVEHVLQGHISHLPWSMVKIIFLGSHIW